MTAATADKLAAYFSQSGGRVGRWLSPHPGKRATERFWLLYTPVWGGACGLVMLTGLANTWGDVPLLLFSLLMASGALLGPVWFRPESERGIPLYQTVAVKLGASVAALAIFLNYTQTPFFFDVLHMHYGFQTHVNIRNNPLALYILTIAYFSTYCVLCQMAYRWITTILATGPRVLRLIAIVLTPFVVAFLETALNANPFTTHLFCYDDMKLMLWFGTFVYGTAFCFALPAWLYVDERPGTKVGLISAVAVMAGAAYADLLMLDLYRYHLAPHLTTVVEGAPGLRDYAGSCLIPLSK